MKDKKITSSAAGQENREPGGRLFGRIEGELDRYTGAERAIASYMLRHRSQLAFETAASLAEKVGVSAVTVGRFCRMLGYKHFKALKNDLRLPQGEAPWLVGPQLAQFVSRDEGRDELRASMEYEMAALAEVYAMSTTPQWEAVVALLAESDNVHVAGLQTERGVGVLMATLLQYVRPGVHLVDPSGGNYAQVFADARPGCLVLFDMRRYSRQTYLLVQRAHEAGIPVVFITDKFCNWAPRYTPHVLALPTETGLFWSSHVAICCAVNLLVNQVIVRLGADVEKRLSLMSDLHQTFTGYVGYPRRKGEAED